MAQTHKNRPGALADLGVGSRRRTAAAIDSVVDVVVVMHVRCAAVNGGAFAERVVVASRDVPRIGVVCRIVLEEGKAVQEVAAHQRSLCGNAVYHQIRVGVAINRFGALTVNKIAVQL